MLYIKPLKKILESIRKKMICIKHMKHLVCISLVAFVSLLGLVGLVNAESSYSTLFSVPNKTYIIDEICDLQGKKTIVPPNCTIIVNNKGKLINGEMVGNSTKLLCDSNTIGVKITGSWHVKEIKDEWFDYTLMSDIDIFSSINNLQSDAINQVVMLNKPVYVFKIEEENGFGINLTSNTKLIIQSTLKLLTNNLKSYQIINVNKKRNVDIIGGRIEGDALEHSDIFKKKSEWGMGICIKESQNVTVDDITIRHCWGDGIYVGGGREKSTGKYANASRMITVNNVTIDDNRRVGLSVIHVDGLKVERCNFLNTGLSKGIKPSSGVGVDIEPNLKKGKNQSCRNVVFSNCLFKGNVNSALWTWNSVMSDFGSNIESVRFDSCTFNGGIGLCLNDIVFNKCAIDDISLYVYSSPVKVTFRGCEIKPKTFSYKVKPRVADSKGEISLSMSECDIDLTKCDLESMLLNPKDFSLLSIEKCNFLIPESYKSNNVIKSKGLKKYLSNSDIKYSN